MKKIGPLLLAVTALALCPAVVYAHVGEHGAYSLRSGFMHPLLGLDHLLALIAAGCWLSQQKVANRWPLLSAFALVLALGISVGVGFNGVTFESGIVATLIVLGALVACSAKLALFPGIAVFATAAAIHGFVHGTELSTAAAGSVSFAAALLLSSILIFVASAAMAGYAQKHGRVLTARIAGVFIMIFGISAIF